VGWPAKKVTNVSDGWHVVRLEQLEAALAALRRLGGAAVALLLLREAYFWRHKFIQGCSYWPVLHSRAITVFSQGQSGMPTGARTPRAAAERRISRSRARCSGSM
jgi:hypothetical protein